MGVSGKTEVWSLRWVTWISDPFTKAMQREKVQFAAMKYLGRDFFYEGALYKTRKGVDACASLEYWLVQLPSYSGIIRF